MTQEPTLPQAPDAQVQPLTESAGAAYGIGLRHRLYWYWWMKQEYMEWIGTYLERVGLGYVQAGQTPEDALKEADDELYACKHASRSPDALPISR